MEAILLNFNYGHLLLLIPTEYLDVTRDTLAQDKVKQEILKLKADLEYKQKIFSNPLSDDTVTSKDIHDIERTISKKEGKLRNLKKNMETSRAKRARKKETLQQLIETNEEAASVLIPITRPGPGRPRLEDEQPGLIEAIIRIVESQTQADPRRRTEILRTGTKSFVVLPFFKIRKIIKSPLE